MFEALRRSGLSPAPVVSLDRGGLRAACAGADALLDARPVGDDRPLEVALEAGLSAAALTAAPDRLVRLRERFHLPAIAAGVSLVVGLEAGAAAAELAAVGLAEAPALGALEAVTSVAVRWRFARPGDALTALDGRGWAWESGQRTRRRAGGPPDLDGPRAALWIPSGATVSLPWRLQVRQVEVCLSLPAALGRPLALLAGGPARRLGRRLPGGGAARLVVVVEGRGARRVRRETVVTLVDRGALTAALTAAALTHLISGETPPGILGPGTCPGPKAIGLLDWTPPRQVDL